ncbi:hypothetical protein AGABI2DRAFT_113794 [Agaricus bisporus var. bisporus H97]|uniref:hypothetical protein n=1 Tax=Agaricus bisporus var. bisporus (strain H97 / ATCC MYA-4626 / FGSC 10389) TaxID=936046 RepID=UPI00029F62B1|nr:hypothetical protein AGABI2DRAFT_113794 [Agaricus bisporus var. bisporus H97]EKV51049.1 hypothetical protein AGABI2DRAFT_113794 [Agaricus bisporus var. bisporus H97]
MGDTTTSTTASNPPLSKTSSPSHPSQQPKLTKKQKKAIAFRRDKSKSSVSKHKPQNDDDEEGFNQMEDLHVALVEKSSGNSDASGTNQMGTVERESGEGAEARSEKAGGSKEGTHDVVVSPQQQKRGQQKRQGIGEEGGGQSDGNGKTRDEKTIRKRKREAVDNGVLDKERRSKKRKSEKDELGVDGVEEGKGEEVSGNEGEGKEKEKDNARLILFIGNLKYTTSVDAIKAHFSACDPPPQIRLLTPKSSSTGKTSNKSKGCAFLEFTNRTGLQQALKLHHSTLEGRMINVELTAGGGGKSEKRMEKVRERNKALLGQRRNKSSKNSKDGSLPSGPDQPQRYSATSGIEQSSANPKRTWTVGDVTEDEARRGGKKHKKGERTRGSRTKAKDWGTGVNAIPVS